jgi:hypothetical protein
VGRAVRTDDLLHPEHRVAAAVAERDPNTYRDANSRADGGSNGDSGTNSGADRGPDSRADTCAYAYTDGTVAAASGLALPAYTRGWSQPLTLPEESG